jgi:hypothetical protein
MLTLLSYPRSGVLPFTGGDALIYGHAISSKGGWTVYGP